MDEICAGGTQQETIQILKWASWVGLGHFSDESNFGQPNLAWVN